MSVNSKIEKVNKSSEKAKKQLLKLVSAKAKSKKILKQVDEIQALDDLKASLIRKIKPETKIKAKDKTVTPKKKSKKVSSKKKDKVKVTKTVSKPSKKDATDSNSKKIEKVIPIETSAPIQILSTSFNARLALTKFNELTTLEEVSAYTVGEERKSVLAKAESRKSSITKGL